MKNRRLNHRKSEKGIKVTYISSPMKVKTSASNFRALVQKLTGKYSNNVAEANFMEEAQVENDDYYYELTVKGSSSSSFLELDEQQWRVVGPEPEAEEEAAPAWLKLLDSTNSLVDPGFNDDQLVFDFLGFDGF